MNELITINPAELPILAQEGSKIVFSPKAEDSLVKLLQLQALLEETITNAKQQIKSAALAYSPSFSSVESDKVRVMYKAYGAAYGLEAEPEDPDELVNLGILEQEVTVKWKIKADAIKKYVKENKVLPPGIQTLPREKQISLTLKKTNDTAVVHDPE